MPKKLGYVVRFTGLTKNKKPKRFSQNFFTKKDASKGATRIKKQGFKKILIIKRTKHN